jgi:hypothetical protein
MKAQWRITEDVLYLVVDGEDFAELTRWSDTKTGEHAWWGVQRSGGKNIAIEEDFSRACACACAAARVSIPPPADLAEEWRAAPADVAPRRISDGPAGFTNVDFARYATSIASKAAKWARDFLDDPAAAPPSGSVERFGTEIAGVLDALSEASTRKPRS